VGFVDGEQGDVQALQERQHARLHQALGRQVEHFHFAALDAGRQVALLLGAEGGVQGGGGHAQLFEGRDLIVHQGDQRRHHHGQAVAQQRRYLEAQGLAATGRHQNQGIAAAGHALNDCTLTATETVVAEDVLEDALSLFEHKNSKNHRNIPARLVQKASTTPTNRKRVACRFTFQPGRQQGITKRASIPEHCPAQGAADKHSNNTVQILWSELTAMAADQAATMLDDALIASRPLPQGMR
jgi:hypothetical protein